MKQLIGILLFLLQGSLLYAQHEKGYIKKGNDLYQQQKYTEAEASYRRSVEKKNQTTEGNFNLGDALYKQKKFADAGKQFNKIAESSGNNKALIAQAYHNLGNTLLSDKKLEESIAAYKKSLINNPKDDETRYNLAYAQEMLKKQQQQNKQNKNNKDQNKDKNKDQNKDNKNQDKDKNKDQNKDKKDQDQHKKDQNGQQPDPNKLSKEDAQRMLDALNNDEKQTQDKLKNKKFKGEKGRVSKDW